MKKLNYVQKIVDNQQRLQMSSLTYLDWAEHLGV